MPEDTPPDASRPAMGADSTPPTGTPPVRPERPDDVTEAVTAVERGGEPTSALPTSEPTAALPATGGAAEAAGAATPPPGTPPPGAGSTSGGGGRRNRILIGAIVAVALVLAGVTIALATHSGSTPQSQPTTTTTTAAPAATAVCPLSGLPAPNNTVPARPALAVKVGNYSGDRPSAGLNEADIVYEEPVEGAITRLVAIYQCNAPALVGDIRSARYPDITILSQFSRPLYVHAGGIIPILNLLNGAPLVNDDLYTGGRSGAIILRPGRTSPYSTFVNTADAWKFNPGDTTPPKPVFQYSPTLDAGAAAGSGTTAHIPFSSGEDVTWTWSSSSHSYMRAYSGQPDIMIGGAQTAATNVVILTVGITYGPWAENSQGAHEVEVTFTGTGSAVVLRGGTAESGSWSRGSSTDPPSLTSSSGQPMSLLPGNTWVELVPQGINVTVSPGASGAPGASTTG